MILVYYAFSILPEKTLKAHNFKLKSVKSLDFESEIVKTHNFEWESV